MSVTTADEKLHSAKEHIKEAIRDLAEIVVNECWGHDEFRADYREILFEVMTDLVAVKKKLIN